MKKIFLILIFITLLFFGCGKYLQPKDDPCATPEATGSLICEKLNNLGLSVYDADLIFKLTNVELIKHNAYTRNDVIEFLNSMENMLESTTYNNLALYTITSVDKLNSEYGMEIAIVLEYMNRFKGVDIPVNAYDIYLIKTHIKNQKRLLGVF